MGCLHSRGRDRWGVRGDAEDSRTLRPHEADYQDYRDELANQSRDEATTARGRITAHLSEDIDAPYRLPIPQRRAVSLPKEHELANVVGQEIYRKFEVASPVRTSKGSEVSEKLKRAYWWKEEYDQPSREFLALMDRLFMECQLHLTLLSSRGDTDSQREVDTIVKEMVAVRNYWGPRLLPLSACNAFVRERISLTLGVEQRQFRIDCAQFFEPVPFYGNHSSSPGELMKLYRYSVYNLARNEVVLRYYLERSNLTQFYHVLCFMDNNCHGQVKPYGIEPPTYWTVRQDMLEDINLRLLNAVSPDSHPMPKPLALTIFPGPDVSQSQAPPTST